jgi:hypothetical protein
MLRPLGLEVATASSLAERAAAFAAEDVHVVIIERDMMADIGLSSPVLNRHRRQIVFSKSRSGHILRSRIFIQDGTVVAAANHVVSTTLLECLNIVFRLGLLKEPISIA